MSGAGRVWALISVMILISQPPMEILNHFRGNRVLKKIQGWECYAKVIYFPSPSDCPEDNSLEHKAENKGLSGSQEQNSGREHHQEASTSGGFSKTFPSVSSGNQRPEPSSLVIRSPGGLKFSPHNFFSFHSPTPITLKIGEVIPLHFRCELRIVPLCPPEVVCVSIPLGDRLRALWFQGFQFAGAACRWEP